MHTPVADPRSEKHGVGAAAKQVAEHASSLARLELELAGLELKQKAGVLGAGIGLAIAAGLLALYALGFGFATIAAALATFLDTWIALLLVTVGLFLVARHARPAGEKPDQARDAARPRAGDPRGEADLGGT